MKGIVYLDGYHKSNFTFVCLKNQQGNEVDDGIGRNGVQGSKRRFRMVGLVQRKYSGDGQGLRDLICGESIGTWMEETEVLAIDVSPSGRIGVSGV